MTKYILRNNEAGGIAVEFALILPLMLILCLPVVDYGRYMLMAQKLVKASSFMADAVSMSTPIADDTTQADVSSDGLFITPEAIVGVVNSLSTMMIPFEQEQSGGEDKYQAVITHVYRDSSGNPSIGWQFDQNSQSFYDSARQSAVGVIAGEGDVGSPANIPAGLASNMDDGENIIVAELTAKYKPITPLLGTLGVPYMAAQDIKYTAYYRARYGNLKCVWGVYGPPPACDPIPGAGTTSSSSGGTSGGSTTSSSSGGIGGATSSSSGGLGTSSSTSSGGTSTGSSSSTGGHPSGTTSGGPTIDVGG